jgi:hypothetical protein
MSKRQDAIDKQKEKCDKHKQRILRSMIAKFNLYVLDPANSLAQGVRSRHYCNVTKEEYEFVSGDIDTHLQNEFTLNALRVGWDVKMTCKKLLSSQLYEDYQLMFEFTFL